MLKWVRKLTFLELVGASFKKRWRLPVREDMSQTVTNLKGKIIFMLK